MRRPRSRRAIQLFCRDYNSNRAVSPLPGMWGCPSLIFSGSHSSHRGSSAELSARFGVTLMHTVTFKAGDAIVSEGAEGKTAYLIVSGSVEVSVGQGAMAKVLATLNPGEVLGEMCLIEPGPRSATVTAVSD